MALDSSISLKSAGSAACIRQGFWKCVRRFPGKHAALRKLPARFVMLLPFLHLSWWDFLLRLFYFYPLLHLIILYDLLDFNLYVFMSFLYYWYLLLYLFLSVFISSDFIYFLNCKCLIFEKSVGFSALCKLDKSTFQFLMAYFRHLVSKKLVYYYSSY